MAASFVFESCPFAHDAKVGLPAVLWFSLTVAGGTLAISDEMPSSPMKKRAEGMNQSAEEMNSRESDRS